MPSEPRIFLESLFAGKPEGYLLLCLTDTKQPIWFGDLEDAIECAEFVPDDDLFVGVGLAKRDYGPELRCPSEDVSGIVGVPVNLDLRSDAHQSDNLPKTIEQAMSILPGDMPPSLAISTGDGIQAWWLFSEPWTFGNDDERHQAVALLHRWNTMLKENAGQLGFTFERSTDLGAVLRVPGSSNCEDSANPRKVTIHAKNDCRYIRSDMVKYLDRLEVPFPEAERLAATEWAESLQNRPLAVNLSARISEERLKSWLDADPRFKNTWFRLRDDFRDQSQDRYDLALASFGFSAGCTEQEIVDLIVHHRSLHRHKARTTVEYFQRTLAKADKRSSGKDPVLGHAGAIPIGASARPATDRQDELEALPPTPERVRIVLCREISAALGIEVLRIVKLTGQVPQYRLELAQGKIEFPSVSKFIDQNTVRDAIAGTTGFLIQRVKSKEWQHIAQMLLSACLEEQGSDELYCEGAARLHIGQYLADVKFIPSFKGQPAQNLRRPIVQHGRITICAIDLQIYINKTMLQNFSVQKIAGMLSAIGAKTVRVRWKKQDQSRWELPLEEFDPSDFPVPESGEPN